MNHKYFLSNKEEKATLLSAGHNILFLENFENQLFQNDIILMIEYNNDDDITNFFVFSNKKIYPRSSAAINGFSIINTQDYNIDLISQFKDMDDIYIILNDKLTNNEIKKILFTKQIIQVLTLSQDIHPIIPLIRLTVNKHIFIDNIKIIINKDDNCLSIYKHIDSEFIIDNNKLSLGFAVIIPYNVYYKIYNNCSYYKTQPGICDSDYIEVMTLINSSLDIKDLLIKRERNRLNNIENDKIETCYGIVENDKFRISNYILISKFKFCSMIEYNELISIDNVPFIDGNLLIGHDIHKGFGSTNK